MSTNSSIPVYIISSSKKGQDSSMDIDDIVDNVIIVIYTLTVFLGITGNSLVIWVASFKLKPMVTNVWLVNLAVADLIFSFTRALSLVKKLFFDYWPYGVFICKFNGFFKYANMFCSVFLLAVISIDRALCVWFPIFTKNRRTLRAARVVTACVWLLASLLSAPYFHYREVYVRKNLTKCSLEVKESNNAEDVAANLALNIIRFSCGFVLPFIVILVCYILTGIGIRRTRFSKKSRPLRILASLVIAFFVCWAPYHCFLLAKMFDRKGLAVKIGLSVAKAFAYFNSCVNPLLYFCMGLNVKSRFRQSLAGVFRRALDEDGRSSTQSHVRTLDDSCSGTQAL